MHNGKNKNKRKIKKKETDFICSLFSNTALSFHKFVIFRTLPLAVLSLTLDLLPHCSKAKVLFRRWDMYSASWHAKNRAYTHKSKATAIKRLFIAISRKSFGP